MNDRDYKNVQAALKQHPQVLQAVLVANKVLTIVGYAAYALLLVLLFVFAPALLPEAVVVPAVSFALVSAFRYLYNAPRPFEVCDINPVVNKNTLGRSFPSRHCFSMAMIASTWLIWQPLVGVLLWICALLLACVRVVCGLHWPRDVICGELFALICAVVGYLLIF